MPLGESNDAQSDFQSRFEHRGTELTGTKERDRVCTGWRPLFGLFHLLIGPPIVRAWIMRTQRILVRIYVQLCPIHRYLPLCFLRETSGSLNLAGDAVSLGEDACVLLFYYFWVY